MNNKNSFKDFGNLYELSKTLRFELRPVGKKVDYTDQKTGEVRQITMTEKMLLENGVFEKDQEVAKNYQEAKKWFDKLHREFIDKTLNSVNVISRKLLQEYEEKYFLYKNDKVKKHRDALNKTSQEMRNKIVLGFKKKAEHWRDGYAQNITEKKLQNKVKELKKLDLLFKVEVFEFLKKKYPEAIINKKSIFDSFNKFSTYFTGFHQTRENFYKGDGTSTAIPTRIVNENLPKFLENKKLFEEKYLEKHDDLFSDDEKEVFTLQHFTKCLSQEQIEKYNDVVAGLRSKINEKRQIADNKNDFPFFKVLFKQILGKESKKETEQSDFIEITTDDEVFKVLRDFINENERQLPKAKKLFEQFTTSQLASNDDFEIDKIYVAGRFINTISNKYFADWNTIRSIFIEKGKKKFDEFISLQTLKNKLQSVEIKKEDFFDKGCREIYEAEDDYYKIFLKIWKKEFDENVNLYNEQLKSISKMMEDDKKFTNKKDFRRDNKGKYVKDENGNRIKFEIQKETIKEYADTALSLYQMTKYFSLESGKARIWNAGGLEEDTAFYNAFGEYYNNVDTWKYFNEFRNYLTKKPYSEDKIKLNFENGTLLDGWSKDKEKENYGIILKKESKYFLGLVHKNNKDIFSQENLKDTDAGNDVYEKVIYEFFKDVTTMIPKCSTQLNRVKDHFKISSKDIIIDDDNFGKPLKISKRIFNLNNVKFSKTNIQEQTRSGPGIKMFQKEYLKLSNNIDVYKAALVDWIDFCKQFLVSYKNTSVFNYSKLLESEEYESLDKFYTDVNKYIYKISFVDIDKKYVDGKVENGELYLFEIYNKDFAEKASGSKKLHTLYWEEIFSKQNRVEPVFKLNGKAEIFFRKASLKKEKELRTKKENAHEVTKNKRYTEDRILFHCPITLNFAKDEIKKDKEVYKGKADAFSVKVREYLSGNKDINIIGIDRGEKHLAYYSVTDQEGNILEMDSFNVINGTDYHKILDKLEKNRDAQRKSWQSISKIKDMKKGYISQVVKKICDLMIEHNAIVVFEDLNVGFKRGRFAIEKQVYQNLELALAKKLNYFVLKDKKSGELGHHARAYQLTPKIDNFQDIYKQCGFMFYIPASYTSAICPVCGFRKNIQTSTGAKEKNKGLIEKFDISYEKEKKRFRFEYKRNDVNNEKKIVKNKNFQLLENVVLKDDFVFYSDVDRLQYSRKDRKTHSREPNESLATIFDDNGIDITKNINEQIKNGDFENKNFYEPLIWQVRLILQLRNADSKEGRDFIECPSCHFHSEKDLKDLNRKYKGEGELEFNGDANGAYNIARKGALVLEKITRYKKKFKDLSKMENKDLTITQGECDKSMQK